MAGGRGLNIPEAISDNSPLGGALAPCGVPCLVFFSLWGKAQRAASGAERERRGEPVGGRAHPALPGRPQRVLWAGEPSTGGRAHKGTTARIGFSRPKIGLIYPVSSEQGAEGSRGAVAGGSYSKDRF